MAKISDQDLQDLLAEYSNGIESNPSDIPVRSTDARQLKRNRGSLSNKMDLSDLINKIQKDESIRDLYNASFEPLPTQPVIGGSRMANVDELESIPNPNASRMASAGETLPIVNRKESLLNAIPSGEGDIAPGMGPKISQYNNVAPMEIRNPEAQLPPASRMANSAEIASVTPNKLPPINESAISNLGSEISKYGNETANGGSYMSTVPQPSTGRFAVGVPEARRFYKSSQPYKLPLEEIAPQLKTFPLGKVVLGAGALGAATLGTAKLMQDKAPIGGGPMPTEDFLNVASGNGGNFAGVMNPVQNPVPPLSGQEPATMPTPEEDKPNALGNTMVTAQPIASPGKPAPQAQSLVEEQPSPRTSGVDEALLNAEERRDNKNFLANIGKAGAQFSASLAGLGAGSPVKVDTSILDSIAARADQPVKDIERRREQEQVRYKLSQQREAMDPNSQMSTLYRDLAKTVLPEMKINSKMSASDFEKLGLNLSSMYNMKQQNESNRALAGERRQLKAEHDKEKQDYKQSVVDTKRLDTLNKDLAGGAARSTTSFGKASITHGAIQNAEALVEGYKSLDDIPPAQMMELARTLDTILSGGGATQSTTLHLTPKTAGSWIADKLAWLKGHPVGARQGGFVENYKDTFKREKIVAQNKMHKHQGEILSRVNDIARRPDGDPAKDTLTNMLGGFGLQGKFNDKGILEFEKPETVQEKLDKIAKRMEELKVKQGNK